MTQVFKVFLLFNFSGFNDIFQQLIVQKPLLIFSSQNAVHFQFSYHAKKPILKLGPSFLSIVFDFLQVFTGRFGIFLPTCLAAVKICAQVADPSLSGRSRQLRFQLFNIFCEGAHFASMCILMEYTYSYLSSSVVKQVVVMKICSFDDDLMRRID